MSLLVLGGAIFFLWAYSIPNLTTKPAVWYDEGINIELARNYAEFGQLDLITTPQTFSGNGHLIGSTGYPVTIPLAWVFSLFGFGFEQARAYMLGWMTIMLCVLWYVIKKQWNETMAAWTVLLIGSFASFYGNGRSVMGEIPGFCFFLLSWYTHTSAKRPFVAGILLGLSIIAKPSVFIFLIPAYTVVLLCKKPRLFKELLWIALGSFVPFLVWLGIYHEVVFTVHTWQDLALHFTNPYQQFGFSSVDNIRKNVPLFFTSSTLVYFIGLSSIIVVAWFKEREYRLQHRDLFRFVAVYSVCALGYFLKSFGYFRYLLGVEFLIYILFVPSVYVLMRRWLPSSKVPLAVSLVLCGIILLQLTQLFTRADLFFSNKPQLVEQYLHRHYPEASVAVLNMPPIAALVAADKKYQMISTFGLYSLGPNTFLTPTATLPDVIVGDLSFIQQQNLSAVVDAGYVLRTMIGDSIPLFERR